ncbi:MAG: hypothetical protein RJB38_666 [Pseudomonadota bacterium]
MGVFPAPMKSLLSVTAALFMTLTSSLAMASGSDPVSIKRVSVRFEADSGPAMGSRLGLAASQVQIELRKQDNTSPTMISGGKALPVVTVEF